MSIETMKHTILDNIPSHFVSYDDLWRTCGSPQEGYHFDRALLDLTKENAIESRRTDRMEYRSARMRN